LIKRNEPLFFSRPADLAVLRWSYKKSRELARRMAFYRGELASMHPAFTQDSDAALQDVASAIDISAPDIVYTAEDDKKIDEFHRMRGELGTYLSQLGHF
jgi:alcohol oxidase